MTTSDDLEQISGIDPFSGNWQGNGVDSEGNVFAFFAKAVSINKGINSVKILMDE